MRSVWCLLIALLLTGCINYNVTQVVEDEEAAEESPLCAECDYDGDGVLDYDDLDPFVNVILWINWTWTGWNDTSYNLRFDGWYAGNCCNNDARENGSFDTYVGDIDDNLTLPTTAHLRSGETLIETATIGVEGWAWDLGEFQLTTTPWWPSE